MTPEEVRDYLEEMLPEDLKVLTPKDRVYLYFDKVLEFFMPKRQRTSINQNDNELPNDIYNG